MRYRELATFNNVATESKPKKQTIVPTADMNYNAGSSHRLEVFKEINSYPVLVGRSIFQKTPHERMLVLNTQSRFKRDGLYEWNERNRPGNNN